MRILMTQRFLHQRGGSEMFALEVSVELRRRGHEVAIYCPSSGDLAKLPLAGGVWVQSRLEDVPWTPDIIHGQHHLQTMAAVAHFPAVPAIYYCHGVKPWVEKPPLHPRILHYVVMCPWMLPRMVSEFGIPESQTSAITNFVNIRRFSRTRPPAARPTRALLFGNGGFPAEELARMEAACLQEGLQLDKIGAAYGNAQPRPEVFLLEYDVVFAIGKCAMEAMACGCAVIPVLPGQAGHLVTPENFDACAHSNFSPRYFTSADQFTAEWLHQELQRYTPEGVSAVTTRLRRECHLEAAVDQLEALYTRVVATHSAAPVPVAAGEFSPYLEMLSSEVDQEVARLEQYALTWERENRDLRGKYEDLREKHRALQTVAKDRELRWKLVVAQLKEGPVGRWTLDKLQRMLRQVVPERETPPEEPPTS